MITLQAVFDVMLIISLLHFQIHVQHHQNVHFTWEIIQQAKNDDQCTSTSINVEENKLLIVLLIQITFEIRLTVRNSHKFINSNTNQPFYHSPAYAQATFSHSNNLISNATSDLTNTITNFFEEFKSFINPLIYLLNKMISKLLNKI